MKIYNKKKFIVGVFTLALGVLNAVMSAVRRDFDVQSAILIIALLALGTNEVKRALSLKNSREDKIDEQDERNILVEFNQSRKSPASLGGGSLLAIR